MPSNESAGVNLKQPGCLMTVHLVNPSRKSFGTAVITPRWLYVLAGATPAALGDPHLIDETLEQCEPSSFRAGDVVGVGIHTANALRGYEVGRIARERGAQVVFGGIHASLYPDEAHELGGAHAVVTGDGEGVWPTVLEDCLAGRPRRVYEGGKVSGDGFVAARWDLLPRNRYMWASVQTVRGCPKHCSFCSVWRTDGQQPRTRSVDAVVREVVELRRKGFRFIALADDNFYPVTLQDLAQADRRADRHHFDTLTAQRAERFELLEHLARLPNDMVFFTQITIEAAEDPAFLDAMKRARIVGALVGVETVTKEGLKSIYKDFNPAGEALVERLRTFRAHGLHVLGSFIFGLSTDRPETFETTLDLATRADLTFAQFVTLTPFPGTVDFARWEASLKGREPRVQGVPLTRHWLIPDEHRPKLYAPHPTMSADEIRQHTQNVWDRFYSTRQVWRRAACARSLRARLAFFLISKLYRQMYANTGISADSARVNRSARWARWLAQPCRRLFTARPMPDLQVPA
jgi:radical SAM superfamily enzyme YgiQ (UPF0313 family)